MTQYLHASTFLIAAALSCAGIGGNAHAGPFGVTYGGTIQNSQISGVIDGERYGITLVFDNGGSSSASQTWTREHLTCVVWTMNNAGNVRFVQNFASAAPNTALGNVTTSAAGQLLTMFSNVGTGPVQPGNYAATGLPSGTVSWWANGANAVFEMQADQTRNFYDAAGGVRMQPAFWGSPTVVRGTCPAPAAPSPGTVAVPALGPVGLAALAGSLGLLGMRRKARRPVAKSADTPRHGSDPR